MLHHTARASWLAIAFALLSCSEELSIPPPTDLLPIELSGSITQQNTTRANDFGFVSGDRMGIYVVDRNGGTPGSIDDDGCRASNVLFTYDATQSSWSSPTPVYWRDRETPVDVYGYYPGVNYIEQPTAYAFSVETDQSREAHDGMLSGYEQSDLLWGKNQNVSYTQEQIVLKYHHVLAGVRAQLIKGEGISDTEWQKLEKIVLVDNTVTTSTVDLSNGTVTRDDDADVSPVRMSPQSGDQYRAVVIPQTVEAGRQLVSITLDGQTYSHSLTTPMTYEGGKLHNFTITVNKREATGDYALLMAYDGITPWTNDETSHQFTANAYVVVHCAEPGHLKESIRATGCDPQTLQNMKVTGELSASDFWFMKGMPQLTRLNLKNVLIVSDGWGSKAAALPTEAFFGKTSLRSIVLPDSLKSIGERALSRLTLGPSTLEIPEGVTSIGREAFEGSSGSSVSLILPYSLDSIGEMAFYCCSFQCELRLSDNLSYIGSRAFCYTDYFHGTFHIPSSLQYIGNEAFGNEGYSRCGTRSTITGEVEIPQGFIKLPDGFVPCLSNRIRLTIPDGVRQIGAAFHGLSLSALSLPGSLIEIGNGAFSETDIPFPITIPDGVVSIGSNAFNNCGIEGELTIPECCVFLGEGCFNRNFITHLSLPSQLEEIGARAFWYNSMLTQVTLPKYLNRINEEAFSGCYSLQTITSLNPEPPELGDGVFQGVIFDKCILQVPEQSVAAYRRAEGWNLFQNITPYHELAVNLTDVTALDKGMRREGIIRAQGDWAVSECPSWCQVEPMSGSGKAEVAITIKAQSKSAPDREGHVVFSLKGKDFTISVPVRQLSYEYGEDETIVLQQASAGAPKAVPLFIVGEGYNAEDIQSGKYLTEIREQIEHLFSCEPFKTYRNYFTVSTAIAVSPQSGIPSFNGSPIEDKTRFGSKLMPDGFHGIDWKVFDYACQHGADITRQREGETTIMVLMNSHALAAKTYLEDNGRSISYIGKSTDAYPYDQRGYVLHEVGGIGFGKLATEDVQHFTFAKACTCSCCLCWKCYWNYKSRGWFENVSASGSRNEVPWSHLIFHPKYSQFVDVYEGAYRHARGFYRSEEQSVMSTYIPYFNTISRESIVRRIMQYAGESYSFEKFVEKDKIEIPE